MLTGWACALLVACGGGGGGGGDDLNARRGAAAGGQPVASAGDGVTNGSGTSTSGAAASVAVASAGDRNPTAADDGIGFAFDLPGDRWTSAGVYDADGVLVRTLWRGEPMGAGRHERRWDRRRDDGSLAAGARYTVRLIHHRVEARWEGVIGNSSESGGEPHRAFLPPQALAAVGQRLHYAVGYNEGQSVLHALDIGRPNRALRPLRHVDPFIGVGLIASDGARLYAAHTGGLDKGSFVFAYALAEARAWRFEAGAALCLNRMPASDACWPDQSYASVLARREAGQALPTGLAVQERGRVLALAYGAEGRVVLFDKLSGREIGRVDVALGTQSRLQLAFSVRGDLWAIGSDRVWRLTDLETQPRVAGVLTGLEQPLAIAADPRDDAALWVAEGGARQQVRRLGSDGQATKVVGRSGGMNGRPEVGDDRLCFATAEVEEHSALAVDGAGLLWIVDSCNNRMLRVDASGQVVDRVAYLPHSYAAAADSGDPRRVFANFLEFDVDPDRAPGEPGAWRLARNWWPALPAALRDASTRNSGFAGLAQVQTLPSGRTLAWLRVHGRARVVELTADGAVRELRTLPSATADATEPTLHPDGALVWATDEGDLQRVHRLALDHSGSDGAPPRWQATAQRWADVPRGAGTPHHRMGTFTGATPPRFPRTAGGQLLFLQGHVAAGEGFHLGAAREGGTGWLWQASPSGALDGRGSFQTRQSDPTVQYGGNVVLAHGRHVVYGYHGEFFTDPTNGRVGQANQFMHFHDSGLFIGQFGAASTRGAADGAEPGRSGNAFSPALVRAGARLLLYHNDESTWGGVHRWHLRGADDVVELRADAFPGGAAVTLVAAP